MRAAARVLSRPAAEARKKFWLDRARTAAIARHTNAFKINEDVVIPLDRLGDYSDGIERINIELSIRNKLRVLAALEAFLQGELPLHQHEETVAAAELVGDRIERARGLIEETRRRWQWLLDNLDTPLEKFKDEGGRRKAEVPPAYSSFILHPSSFAADWQRCGTCCRTTPCGCHGRKKCARALADIFSGRAFFKVIEQIDAIHKSVLRGRVFVALHMHAGDGNVHTNIPVNSDNYEMLQEASQAVARIMRLAESLDGVISGEHGIGITKLDFLDAGAYRRIPGPTSRRSIPKGGSTRASCSPGADLDNAYTPSFALLGTESLILEHSDIGGSPIRSRTACAAANASRCAQRTCRAPTCFTVRATRSSPRAC